MKRIVRGSLALAILAFLLILGGTFVDPGIHLWAYNIEEKTDRDKMDSKEDKTEISNDKEPGDPRVQEPSQEKNAVYIDYLDISGEKILATKTVTEQVGTEIDLNQYMEDIKTFEFVRFEPARYIRVEKNRRAVGRLIYKKSMKKEVSGKEEEKEDYDTKITDLPSKPELEKELSNEPENTTLTVEKIPIESIEKEEKDYPVYLLSEVRLDLDKIYTYGYINGMGNYRMNPLSQLTREQAAQILYNLIDSDQIRNLDTRSYKRPYDVQEHAWSSEAIKYAILLDLFDLDNGKFNPKTMASRAEVARAISRIATEKKMDSKTFSDIRGHRYEDAINLVASRGWISGYPDGTFHPDGDITRAEFVTMVNGMLGRQARNQLRAQDITFYDVNPGDWYYGQILSAVNGQ